MSHSWVVKVVCLSQLFRFTACDYYYNYDYYDNYEDENHLTMTEDNSLRCQRYNSCSQYKDNVRNCFCDTMCHNYDDCCPDVLRNVSTVYMPAREAVDCDQEAINGWFFYVSIISQCPNTSKSDESKKCTSIRPLVFGGKSRLIYKNIHCSRCNGEETFEFLPFTILCQTTYTHDKLKEMLLEVFTTGNHNMYCHFSYGSKETNKEVEFHPCLLDLVSSCPEGSDPEDVISCMTNPMDAVYGVQRRFSTVSGYRNEFCARCNNVTVYSCYLPQLPPFPVYEGYNYPVDIEYLQCLTKEGSLEEILKCKSEKDHTLQLTGNLNNGTDRNASQQPIKEKATPKELLTNRAERHFTGVIIYFACILLIH